MRAPPFLPSLAWAALALTSLVQGAGSAAAQVEVAPLAAPDEFSAGTGAVTGLGPELWRGSSGAVAREVIPRLEPRLLSVAGLGLARRVLSTGAPGPEGAGADPAVGGARALLLLALGDAPGVVSMLERTPGWERSEPLARAAAEAALIAGAPDRACAVAQGAQVERSDAYWLRLRSYCLARAGKGAEAQLAYNLAVQGSPKNEGFARLMAARLAGSGAPGAGSAADGLDAMLSRELGAAIAEGSVAAAPLPIQAALATDDKAPGPVRIIAAAYALRLGLLPPEMARAAYAGATGAPSVQAAGAPPRRRGARAPAIHAFDAVDEARRLAALQAETDPAAKAAALAELLSRAESAAGFTALARLTRPELAQLSGAPIAGARGALFASAAATAGDPAAAQAYRARLRADGPDAVTTSELAMVDAILSAATGAAPSAVLDRLAERGAAGDARAQAATALLAALADPKTPALSPDARGEFAQFELGPSGAAAARMLALDGAAEAALQGETALLALSIAQGSGAAGQKTADRARLIGALRRAGLAENAAAFALEGLLELQRR